ncbi:MAG: hypothetical protein IKN49_01550 [Elusimicrobiaceae bacterium]|nr:hypothetical protein [Elusimicrobiaceae bacterium]
MKKGKKSVKLLDSVKKGLKDIKLVLEEGNYKLFLKQLVVIIVLIFAYRYVNTMFHEQQNGIASQIEAVHAQQNNEQAYLTNKKKLLELEPRFPDLETKNDWLLRQVVAIFKDSPIQPSIGSSQSENTSNNGYTVVSLPVSIEASYHDFGKLLASIENKDEMLRVSEFFIDKQENSLGSNNIKMQINTIFPKEKIAKTMFKEETKKAEGKK